MTIDTIDSKVLSALQKDARASWAELAEAAAAQAQNAADQANERLKRMLEKASRK